MFVAIFDPGPMMCPERMRATLSTDACHASWRRADELNDGSHNSCRLCPIGAVHAGEVAASMSPLKGTLTCARCHRSAGRLIHGMVCVSCYMERKGKAAPIAKPEPIELEMLRRLVQLCHPDKHANSEASNTATRYLLALKEAAK